jgi:hypothetical protein
MSPVFALDADFARYHVPGLLLLGALRIGGLVRSSLPPPDPEAMGSEAVGPEAPPASFEALLLGVLSVDARLRALVPPPEAPHSPAPPDSLEGLLR